MINYFWIEIKGKDVKRLLTKIFKLKINIASIKYEKDRILLKVSYEDYIKIKKIKTTYQINIIKTCGKKKLFEDLKKYKVCIITFIISVFFVVFLSNFILFVNIETNNIKLKNLIREELKNNNLTIFSLKKTYNNLNKITLNIKNRNLDRIEWIELDQNGVFLNIKVIERVADTKNYETGYKDIVAEKDGYIRKIYSRKGQVLKNIDDYVKKGEVIISGNIFRGDKPVAKVKASGKVYAEVWYIVKLNKSFYYNKVTEDDKCYLKLVLNVNDKEITFLKLPKRITIEDKNILFDNNLFKLYLKKEKKYKIEKSKYTEYELQKILEKTAENEILKGLEKDEYKLLQKTLKKYNNNGKMYIEVFFKTYEDISLEKNIQKIETEKEEE
ncbi:MAG: sporulation protein YqfD [Bacilli bacterium]